MTTLSLPAFAKINLALFITDRLPNGYHTLETIFKRISWSDTLHLEEAHGLSMRSDTPELPTDERNLCLKAAKALQLATGCNRGCRITLEKRIPHGAGLGGGSSDAASTLLGLNTLWELGLGHERLHAIGVSLGADVPFFLSQWEAARGVGIGDKLTRLNGTFPYSIVVAFPRVLVPTVWAYRSLRLTFPKPAPHLGMWYDRLIKTPRQDTVKELANDFEPSVMAEYPVIGALKQAFYNSGAIHSVMSGSGSAVFGLFESSHDAERAADHLRPIAEVSLTLREESEETDIA